MKKFTLKSAALILIAAIGFTACKKKDVTTANSSIQGNWTLSELGTDINSNNILDAGETMNVAGLGISGTLNLSASNTFNVSVTYAGSTDSQSGTYTFDNNTIISTYAGGRDTAKVVSVTSNKMVLLESPETDKQWEVYTR